MLIEQIDQAIVIAIIGVLAAVLPIGISYVLTKNKEIDFSIRQEKTERYDGLIDSLVVMVGKIGIIERGDDTKFDSETVSKFITAYHRASTYASDLVLQKCNDLVLELMKQKGETEELKDRVIDIYGAIRRDINPKAKYSTIGVMWPAKGVKSSNKSDKGK